MFYPRAGPLVPTLSLRLGDFTLTDIGNLPVPTPQCPMSSGPGGGLTAVNCYGLTRGLVPPLEP
jgi:hypothetical protein